MPAIRIHADAAGHADFAALQFVPVVIHVIGVQRGLGLQAGSGYPDQCRQPECCESCGTHHRTTSRGPYLLTERSVATGPEQLGWQDYWKKGRRGRRPRSGRTALPRGIFAVSESYGSEWGRGWLERKEVGDVFRVVQNELLRSFSPRRPTCG